MHLKQQTLVLTLSATLLLSTAASALALSVDQIPNPRQVNGWVSDTAHVISDDQTRQLNQLLQQVKSTTGAEVAIVTVAEAAPSATCKDAATKLFHFWQIGQKGKDNGLLTLVCLKERRVEQETGYGLESVLPDLLLLQLQQQHLVPAFKQQQYGAGLVADHQALANILLGKAVPALPVETQSDWLLVVVFGMIMLVFGMIIVVFWRLGRSSGSSDRSSRWSDMTIADCPSPSSSGSSDRSSRDSGSDFSSDFGGGDSGGGGSGSDW